ncbi:endo-1,4-beta-xylanase [Streptomyces sp. RFCAC02]|uniref:endo-1,4-beta-xylanase n=1 Tax=Streptomyces sp. RFCAC02 TaxID=2499143 RepID=UPI0010210471|nr:endo-1,4-beta-xylanase [Streptomyces sp. RFCAC02]
MRASPSRPLSRALRAVLAAAAAATATLLPAAPAAAADPVTVAAHTFEDGTAQGWGARGGETVAAVTGEAHGGTGALAATGRTATWQGPVLDVTDLFETGTEYTVSLWARLAEGSAGDTVRLSLERRVDGVTSYSTLGSATATADGWVELTGSHLPAVPADHLGLYVETATVTDGLLIDDVSVTTVPETPIQTDIPSLHEVFPDFATGVAVGPSDLYGERARLLDKHFTSLTPGNALKWDATEPTEGAFRFTDADPVVEYAAAHGMALRGHTLVWHQQTPAWVFLDAEGAPMTPTEENKELLLSRLEAHIRAVAGRYGDAIGVWDVVNEVIDENQADGMRRSRWYEITGLDYIRTAFRVAHEVAPDAELFINDYNTNVPAKRDALAALVSRLRAEGVPIDGVGHQMHINVEWPSVAETEEMLTTFAALGVDQQITEMDVSVYTSAGESFPTPPADRLLAQARQYRAMFDLFTRYGDAISSVTLWGLGDDGTWLDGTRDDAPLLFDDDLQAKSAYWAVVDPAWDGTGTGAPAARCTVTHETVGEWPGSYLAHVTIGNPTDAPVGDWSLTWRPGPGEEVTQVWNGSLSASGGSVTVTAAAWNGTIPPGGSVTFGLITSRTDDGVNHPTYFTLNGSACTTA